MLRNTCKDNWWIYIWLIYVCMPCMYDQTPHCYGQTPPWYHLICTLLFSLLYWVIFIVNIVVLFVALYSPVYNVSFNNATKLMLRNNCKDSWWICSFISVYCNTLSSIYFEYSSLLFVTVSVASAFGAYQCSFFQCSFPDIIIIHGQSLSFLKSMNIIIQHWICNKISHTCSSRVCPCTRHPEQMSKHLVFLCSLTDFIIHEQFLLTRASMYVSACDMFAAVCGCVCTSLLGKHLCWCCIMCITVMQHSLFRHFGCMYFIAPSVTFARELSFYSLWWLFYHHRTIVTREAFQRKARLLVSFLLSKTFYEHLLSLVLSLQHNITWNVGILGSLVSMPQNAHLVPFLFASPDDYSSSLIHAGNL